MKMVTAIMKLKRCLLPGRKFTTNLDSIFKKQRHHSANKGLYIKAMVFPVVMYKCESWAIKKAEYWRIYTCKLWRWRRLLRVPWTARISNNSILKEINPEFSLEWLMLKLKLQYFGHLMWRLTHWKRPWCWERLRAGREGVDREWDGWMASPTQWTWGWANSGRQWRTGKPGMLHFMGLQKTGHNLATKQQQKQSSLRW